VWNGSRTVGYCHFQCAAASTRHVHYNADEHIVSLHITGSFNFQLRVGLNVRQKPSEDTRSAAVNQLGFGSAIAPSHETPPVAFHAMALPNPS